MQFTSDFHPSSGAIPVHVGIIPDGGRRWAKAHSCTLREAYSQTKASLQIFVNYLIEKGALEISIYLSSIQNFRRNLDDLTANLDLIELALNNEIAEIAKNQNIKVIVAGNREILPKSLRVDIDSLEQLTRNNTRVRLNLLLAFDPFEEIINAMKASEIPDHFLNHLLIKTPVDLVIRSGGAPLLSNFLPLQSAYARLCFFDKLFNDLTTGDLDVVMENFAKTKRKFGE
ncbi:MAG: polyprenyl diphosphate synthase [Bacteroidota bacterium]